MFILYYTCVLYNFHYQMVIYGVDFSGIFKWTDDYSAHTTFYTDVMAARKQWYKKVTIHGWWQKSKTQNKPTIEITYCQIFCIYRYYVEVYTDRHGRNKPDRGLLTFLIKWNTDETEISLYCWATNFTLSHIMKKESINHQACSRRIEVRWPFKTVLLKQLTNPYFIEKPYLYHHVDQH